MPDRGKIIKGLECCGRRPVGSDIVNEGMCNGCPYCGELYCGHNLTADALALLREHEPARPTWRLGKLCCGMCGTVMPRWSNYCPYCGRAVKQND